MHKPIRLVLLAIAAVGFANRIAEAAEQAAPAENQEAAAPDASGEEQAPVDDQPSTEELRSAITKAIPLIEAGSAGSAEHRTCFTCHSQAVPIVALARAKEHGFAIDVANFSRQIQHTSKHLERGRKGYLAGKGQGGQVVTAGYALWALAAGGEKPNEDTAAVTGYLLTHQRKQNYWSQGSQRPPSAGSHFTNTYLALRALDTFGTEEQGPLIQARIQQVQPWLVETQTTDTEDRAFRLRALKHVDVEEAAFQAAVDQLVDAQREDGGWGQKDDMDSDAYATGTALVALLQAGQLPSDHRAVRRGVRYLLDRQLEDGSWHVVTRAKGFQTYFETGFPHGKDQFISTAASAWSMLALLLVLPEPAETLDTSNTENDGQE